MKLIAFGANNFLSFKEGFEVSLTLPAKEEGFSVSNALCVVGANASGKSNVLRTLTYIAQFCSDSFNIKPEENLGIYTYGFGSEPAFFFVEFIINNTLYSYEAMLTDTEIVREKLTRKIKKTVLVFERNYNTIEYVVGEFSALKKIKLRRNASIISMAHQYGLSMLSEVYFFFSKVISNIDTFFGETTHSGRSLSVTTVSQQYNDSEELFSFIKEKLAEADTGISDIHIIESLSPKQKYVFPFFIHKSPEGDIEVPFHLESRGTRLLYTQLGLYKEMLDEGGVLILDEFDNNLHPDLLGWLLDLFLDPKTNPNNGQLIFTSHNTAIMEKLTKYQVVAVNKKDNESFLYRLDELPGNIIRNNRSLEAIYKSGKIGGTPGL